MQPGVAFLHRNPLTAEQGFTVLYLSYRLLRHMLVERREVMGREGWGGLEWRYFRFSGQICSQGWNHPPSGLGRWGMAV
jgi:hypothetical protein